MNVPNTLSVIRIVLIPVFVVLYFLPFAFAPYLAFAVFVLASFTDFLDGYIARKYNLITDLGKLLDPIADKLLVTAALFLITATNPLANLQILDQNICLIITACVSVVIIGRELLVSMVRQIAAAKGKVIQANKWGKAKTVTQMIALPVLIILNSANVDTVLPKLFYEIMWYIGAVMFALSFVLTIISGTIYIIQNRAVFSQEEKAQ